MSYCFGVKLYCLWSRLLLWSKYTFWSRNTPLVEIYSLVKIYVMLNYCFGCFGSQDILLLVEITPLVEIHSLFKIYFFVKIYFLIRAEQLWLRCFVVYGLAVPSFPLDQSCLLVLRQWLCNDMIACLILKTTLTSFASCWCQGSSVAYELVAPSFFSISLVDLI